MDRSEGAPGRIGRGPLFAPLPTLLLLAWALLFAFLFHHEVLGYALVGHDTYPIIRAARVESLGDFASTFTEELMDGRYPEGHFYRPLLNLSFALDHALYGLRPWGYHLTDLLLLALAAFSLPWIAGRSGRTIGLAGFAATFLFLAHPVHLNILPVAARRADMLALLFTICALLSSGRTGRLGRWAPAVFAFLAAGSKETGAIAPLLLFARALLFPAVEGKLHVRAAVRSAALPAAAVLLLLLARQGVIGGLGGHASLSLDTLLRRAPLLFLQIERYTAAPFLSARPIFGSPWAGPLLFALLALGSALLLRRGPDRAVALLAWIWIVLAGAVHVLSLSYSPWYALHAVAPFALLSGVLLDAGLRTLFGSGRGAVRAASTLLVLAILSSAALNTRNTPLFAFHPEWKDASRKVERFLGGLEEQIRRTPPGTTVDAPGLPFLLRYRTGSPIGIVAPLADYSVQAWAELVFPGRDIRVARNVPPPGPPRSGEILVVVSPDGPPGRSPLDGAPPRR